MRHLKQTLITCLLNLTGLVLTSLPARAADASVSLSPWEGWNVSLRSPVLYTDAGSTPTAGVSFGRGFAIGQALAPSWGDWAQGLNLGIDASVFLPLNFQQLYLGASVGLSHSTPLWGSTFLDYGLSYAPLVQVDWAANTSTGYNGLLANLGLHLQLAPNTWSTLGLQAGFYAPFTGGQQLIWVVQPLVGLNLSL